MTGNPVSVGFGTPSSLSVLIRGRDNRQQQASVRCAASDHYISCAPRWLNIHHISVVPSVDGAQQPGSCFGISFFVTLHLIDLLNTFFTGAYSANNIVFPFKAEYTPQNKCKSIHNDIFCSILAKVSATEYIRLYVEHRWDFVARIILQSSICYKVHVRVRVVLSQ